MHNVNKNTLTKVPSHGATLLYATFACNKVARCDGTLRHNSIFISASIPSRICICAYEYDKKNCLPVHYGYTQYCVIISLVKILVRLGISRCCSQLIPEPLGPSRGRRVGSMRRHVFVYVVSCTLRTVRAFVHFKDICTTVSKL